jgi:hypothetical protein
MYEMLRSSEEIMYITTFNSSSACIRALQVRDDHIHFCQFRNNFLVWLHSAEVGTERETLPSRWLWSRSLASVDSFDTRKSRS